MAKMNVHRWLAALSIGGATAVGAASGGTAVAVAAGIAAALGVLARPSQVSRRLGNVARKIPGMRPGQVVDGEDPR
jgi:hypothetical protein